MKTGTEIKNLKRAESPKQPEKPEEVPVPKFAEFQPTAYEYERLNYWLKRAERFYVFVQRGETKYTDFLLYSLENVYLIIRPLLKGTKTRERMDKLFAELEELVSNMKFGKEKFSLFKLKMKFREFFWKLKDLQEGIGMGVAASSYEGYLEEELEEEEL